MSTKIRVGVFMGGRSIEREVSFNSGRTVCDHLDSQRFEIIPIYQTITGELYILPLKFLYRGKTVDFEHKLSAEAQKIAWETLPTLIDFMYIAAHGQYAENGALQGFLEILKIPYLGSKVRASALGMNKILQKKILRAHNITVPRDIIISPEESISSDILERITATGLQFPVIVKPAHEGSSLGVTLAHDFAELTTAITHARTIDTRRVQEVLIEEYITGLEFTCITLTNYITGEPFPLPPTEIVSDTNSSIIDYEQKYMPGRAHKYTPARCSPEDIKHIQESCIRVNTILEITTISRIDGIITPDKKVVIFDPNTLSGMAPTSFMFRQAAAVGMNHTQFINHLINTELHYYGLNTPK